MSGLFLSNADIIGRLLLATGLGLAVGYERERVDQPAGLRDHALVSVGSALVMIVSACGFQDFSQPNQIQLDPSRMAAQVVSGIGFLGAGTIVLRRDVVRGLTTAASIWSVAAIGLAVGGGLFVAAIAATVLLIGILSGIKTLETKFPIRRRRSILTIFIEQANVEISALSRLLTDLGLSVQMADLRDSQREKNEERIDFIIGNVNTEALTAAVDTLRKYPGVRAVRSTINFNRH